MTITVLSIGYALFAWLVIRGRPRAHASIKVAIREPWPRVIASTSEPDPSATEPHV